MKKEEVVLTEEQKEELELERQESYRAKALSGFIISIAAHVFGLGIAGLILSIIGLIQSSKGLRCREYPHKSLATVGNSISIIELVLNVVNIIVSAVMLTLITIGAIVYIIVGVIYPQIVAAFAA